MYSNFSAYPSYSADATYSAPVVNPNMYTIVVQILTQLRAVQSDWNAWKVISTSFQNSLHKEQQLRFQDRFNFHVMEQQLLNQIESLRSELEKAKETNTTLGQERDVLQQNLSLCIMANLHAQSRVQDLENTSKAISTFKKNILNLTKVIQKKDELLLQTMEETERNNKKLQEALQTIKDKDVQLQNVREERKAMKENLELIYEEIRNSKADERENQSKFQKNLEEKLDTMEAGLVRQSQLNDALTMQRDEFQKLLEDVQTNSQDGKHDINEELKRFKEAFDKFIAQEAESQFKTEKDLTENLNIMAESLTKQNQLNEQLSKQKDELKNVLAEFKNKSKCEKREINEVLNKFTEENIIKLKAEERENQSKFQHFLEEKLNLVDTLTKQLQRIEELRKQNEALQKSLVDLESKSEGEKRLLKEELSICKENVTMMGPCGPAQLRQIKMPEPEGHLYKTGLQKHMLPGCIIKIIGRFKDTGDTPSINLDFPHGIALHIVFRFTISHICRNTYSDGKWGPEETGGGMPVKRGQNFNVTITSTAEYFQICINGVMFATYKHRIDKQLITGIWIGGPIELQKVLYFTPNNI